MEEETVNNNMVDDVNHAEYEFKFNFINMPWDDRSTKSKFGILSLLLAIFAATMAVVAHNFHMHYLRTPSERRGKDNDIKCHLVKLDEYSFAARIHSVETQELLCVGAMVSYTAVLADGVCVKSGPVRLRLGSNSNLMCKKGFTVDAIEPIHHDGTVSKVLVLLITYESMKDCGQVIKIGDALDKNIPAYIFGRPLANGKLLSRQAATVIDLDTKSRIKFLNINAAICAVNLVKCPVKAGDLLVQNNLLYGLASTSTHITEPSKVACFSDLRLISSELKT